MRVLVTGGTGFVGSAIVKELVKEHEVYVIGSSTEQPIDGVKKTLYMGLEGVDWSALKGIDAVIHQAANNDTLFQDETEMYRANVFGPIKLYHQLLTTGCRKFIHASSTAVFGMAKAPYTDSTIPEPFSLYGETKNKFDQFAQEFAKDHGVQTIGLRYCNIYGPGESHKGKRMSMVSKLIRQVKETGRVQLFEYGEQRRDWIYIKDIVRMNLLALNSNKSGIYNVGTGQSHSFNDVVHAIFKESDYKTKIDYIPCPLRFYQSHTECDIKKLWQDFEFLPQFSLETGIDDYFSTI